MRNSILGLIVLCPVLALAISCGDDDSGEDCVTGEEQICYCEGQYAGIQTCEDGVWGECWCAGAADSDSDSDADEIDQSPEVQVTASPISGLAPLDVNFVAHVAGGEEPLEFLWDFGDGSDGTGQNASHAYTADGTYTAVVTVTDADGDQGIGSATVMVGANLAPTVEITATPTLGYAPLSVDFEAVAMGGNPPYTYEWDFNGDDTVDATISDPSNLFAPGSHEVKVTVTDSDGDQGEDTIDIFAALPDQVPEPIAEIVEGDCIAVPGEQAVQLNGFGSSDLEGEIMYEWVFVTIPMEEEDDDDDDDDDDINDLEFEPSPYIANPRFTPPINGTYQVQLFITDGTHTVGSEVLTIEVSDEAAEVIPVQGDGQSARVYEYFDEIFIAQVVNSCGAPLPDADVYINGFNAWPGGLGRDYQYYTDDNGYVYFPGMAAYRAGQAGLKVRAGCVTGVFDLTVTAGDAAFFVMTGFDGTPVVSDENGADLRFEVTDQYLNPVPEEVQFGLELYTDDPNRADDDDDDDFEYYYYCFDDDDDDDDGFIGGACFEESMDDSLNNPFEDEDCRSLGNILTDANGTRTVSIISRTDQPVEVRFQETARIVSGPNIGQELITFGREIYGDSFESASNWSNWVKGKEEDSQWERGVPATGVGPSSAHTGANLIGTNLSGDYVTPDGQVPFPSRQEEYPIYQDDAYRPIQSLSFERTYNWPEMTFIEFWHWYDMIGDTCPDCAAAVGFVSDRSWTMGGVPVRPTLDTDIDVDSDYFYYDSWGPEGSYPSPELCYYDEPFRPNGLPRWGYTGKSDGWEPAYFRMEGITRKTPEDMALMHPAFVFSTSTMGEADGAGWYIDDLTVTNLFRMETGFLYVEFAHDAPDHTRICRVQDGYVYDEEDVRQEPEPPMCTESANAVVYATVYDQFHNRIYEPGIELLFGADDGEGSLSSALFEEALIGDLVSGAGTNVARATTDEDGEIVLTIDNVESEEVEVSSDLEGILFADDETWVYFYNTSFNAGDCCENPYDIGTDAYFYRSFNICDFHALDQLPECGDPTRRDVVIKFQPSVTDLYYVDQWHSWGWDTIAELRVLDDDGNCPGTLIPNEEEPDLGNCMEGGMYAYLYKDKTYILSIQMKDQNDNINCGGSGDDIYIEISIPGSGS